MADISNNLITESYSEPKQTSKIKRFAKIANGFQSLTILPKSSVLDIGQEFKHTSELC